MPEIRRVNTLKGICLSFISKNLSLYPTQELQTLTWKLSEDLVQFLYDEDSAKFQKKDNISRTPKEGFIRFSEMNRLIRPNMRRLNVYFSHRCNALCNDTLTAVLQTSKSLTHFACEHTGRLRRKDLLKIVVSIPNIVNLKITHDSEIEKPSTPRNIVNGEVLQAIGDHCFKLETLQLSSSNITDNSIRRLWQSKSGGCKIKYLGLDDHELSRKGHISVLYNLKELKIYHLEFSDFHLAEALVMLYQELQVPIFQLSKLPRIKIDGTLPTIPKGFLNYLTKCCPCARNLGVRIGSLDELEELRNCSEDVTFDLILCDMEISMSQLSIGTRVTSLDMWSFNCTSMSVDLVEIGNSLPNLSELGLSNVKYLPFDCTKNILNSNAFSKLLKLKLDTDDLIPFAHLDFLFGKCLVLQNVSIQIPNKLTDRKFLKLLQGNDRLRRLTDFEFLECDKVGKKSILGLLEMENDLKMVRLIECKKFSEGDIKEIECYIKEHNYYVTLEIIRYDL